MAGAAPKCSATVGSGGRAGPRGGRACPWLPLLSLPASARPSAGISAPALSPLWGQSCEGSHPPPTAPPALTHTLAWFSPASPRHRMAPAGSAVSHLHLKGSVVTRGGCLQILPTRPARRMSPATAASAASSAATPPSLLRPSLRGARAEPATGCCPRVIFLPQLGKHSRDEQKECACRYVHTTVL
ncbi:hypothetical protein mRhiFer1_009368 [Rhinolophus ferrumequinum]|uniref:Uncharacterized protein n=1 Tax=Rhinolophus ferrumequinum TaxID=59479 RepID=A0A7J7RPI2_RHIFE|nr:hypothetical protein mRhiFer1_009368 [Rhinolophus ferrumequinum]